MRIKLILLLVLPIFLFTSCDSEDVKIQYSWWYLDNNSSQTVCIIDYIGITRTIAPNERFELASGSRNRGGNKPYNFYELFEYSDIKDSISLYQSDYTTLLKTWRMSEKDDTGKQFYNEVSWHKEENISKDAERRIWIFTIEDSDL